MSAHVAKTNTTGVCDNFRVSGSFCGLPFYFRTCCTVKKSIVDTVATQRRSLPSVHKRTPCSHMHVGYVHQCLHKREPCDFSTFFNVSVATNVTARDARVTSRTNFQ